MKHVLVSLVVSMIGFASLAYGNDANILFELKGKAYRTSDLDPALRQEIFETEQAHFSKLTQVIDEAVFETHVSSEAAKKKKSVDEMRAQILKSKEPSEKEMKAWYEENKERIPYPYDKIKADIAKLLVATKEQEQKQKIVDNIKKKDGFKLAIKSPEAPVLEINTAGSPFKGNEKAKVVIVEFADYQCPHCMTASAVLKRVVERYKDKVAFHYMDFPINRSGISTKVSEGGVCANEQKKFWEYHYMAFEQQASLNDNSPLEFAKKLGLDEAAFKTCFESKQTKDKVAASKAEGERIGVQATPSVFINGQKVSRLDEKDLSDMIEKALAGKAS